MPRNNILTGNILPSGGFAPAIFQGNTFTPQQADMSLLARSLDKIEQRELATNQQRGAIAKALAELDLNPAEDQWRTDYANSIQDQISELVQFGDYSGALNRAAVLAGDMFTNPGLRGRLRAQQDYKKFVDETQKRTDIDQRTKNWALATNPYSYADITDDKGNVIGGTEWQPSNRPVGQIDFSKLGTLALQWAKPETHKGSSAMFVKEDGSLTPNYSKDVVDIAYQTSGGWTKLGKEKLEKAINAAIDMTPGGRAAIEQDYKVAMWDYNKLSDEEKSKIGDSEITDTNGRLLTQKEFLAKKINPWLDASSYSNSDFSTTYHTGLQTAYSLRQQRAADAYKTLTDGANNVNFTGQGIPVTFSTSDYIQNAQGTVDDAIASIEGAMPQFKRNAAFQAAKNSGNYETIERLVKNTKVRSGQNYYDTANDNVKRIVNNALTKIYNNRPALENVNKILSKGEKDIVMFDSARKSGQKLPNNNISKDFYGKLSSMFNSKDEVPDTYVIKFNDADNVRDFCSKMGMNEESITANGMSWDNEDGYRILRIPASSNLLPSALFSISHTSDPIFHLPWRETRVTSYASGKALRTQDATGDAMRHFTQRFETDINNRMSVINRKTTATRSTAQSVISEIPAILDARRKRDAGVYKPSDFEEVVKDVNRQAANALNGDWNQLSVYMYDENTGTMTIADSNKKFEALPNILGHLRDGNADISFQNVNGILSGYRVTLNPKRDKDGNYSTSPYETTYFISGGIKDEGLDKFNNDPKTLAMAEYSRQIPYNGNYRSMFGTSISNINNNSCTINGIPGRSPQEAQSIIQLDKNIEKAINYFKYNGYRQEDYDKLINGIMINLNTNDSSIRAKVENVIQNKLR